MINKQRTLARCSQTLGNLPCGSTAGEWQWCTFSHPACNAAKKTGDLWTANVCWHVNLSILNITRNPFKPIGAFVCLHGRMLQLQYAPSAPLSVILCVEVFDAAVEWGSLKIHLTSSEVLCCLSHVDTSLHTKYRLNKYTSSPRHTDLIRFETIDVVLARDVQRGGDVKQTMKPCTSAVHY